MTVTAKTAAYNITLDTTGGNIYSSTLTDGAGAIIIVNRDATNDLLVSVKGLHAWSDDSTPTDFVRLAPGEAQEFQVTNRGLTKVWAKASAATCNTDWFTVAKLQGV